MQTLICTHRAPPHILVVEATPGSCASWWRYVVQYVAVTRTGAQRLPVAHEADKDSTIQPNHGQTGIDTGTIVDQPTFGTHDGP